MIKNCIKELKSGAAKQGYVHMEDSSEGVYKHWAGEGWVVISVDQEHGTGMDHIAAAPATHH